MEIIGKNERHNISETLIERDFGIQLSNDLKWKNLAVTATNKGNSVLGMLKRTFVFWNETICKQMYTTFVRSHQEYAASAWNPYSKKDIKALKNIQRRATKLAPSLNI